MTVAEDILCSKTHEYVMEKDGYYFIGLTEYLIKQLDEIVFLELPENGLTFSKGEIFGSIQGVNSSRSLHMPISGTIIDVNENVVIDYDKLTEAPWLIKISSKTAATDSIDLLEYEDYMESI